MSRKGRWDKKGGGGVPFPFSCAALALIFLMGFWLGMLPVKQAFGVEPPCALNFDGAKNFVSIPIDSPTCDPLNLNQFTVQVRVRPGPFSEFPSAWTAFLRAAFITLPDKGNIERSQYSWALGQINKQEVREWGLSICTPHPACQSCTSGIEPEKGLEEGEWQDLAATYDGSYIRLYKNGLMINKCEASGEVDPVLVINVGRWVAAWYGDIDFGAVYNGALDNSQIQESYKCGPVTFAKTLQAPQKLVGYWGFEECGGQIVTDSSTCGNDGWLGVYDDPNILETAYDPAWTSGEQSYADSDGDGYTDLCDNCPDDPNDQLDSDGDGVGDDCDGITETIVSAAGSTAYTQLNFTPKRSYYFVPPAADCTDTQITCVDQDCITGGGTEADCMLTPRDVFPAPVVTVKDQYGNIVDHPLDDVESLEKDTPYAWDVQCDLNKIFSASDLANHRHICCYATYGNFISGYDASEKAIWRGAATSTTQFCQRFLDINIKPTSYPNNINLSGGGVLPVLIYGAAGFNVHDVDLSSLTLIGNATGLRHHCPEGVEFISNVQYADFGSHVSSEQPPGPTDGHEDLWVHFNQRCFVLSANDTVGTIEGATSDGTNFRGSDSIQVFE